MTAQNDNLDTCLARCKKPVVVLSSAVGSGNISIGDAIKERLGPDAIHLTIEELLPVNAVREDLFRYRWISDRAPILLNLVYRVPFFYQRKLVRERLFKTTDLGLLRDRILASRAKTVIAVSHRQAFWTSLAKARYRLDVDIVGVLTEFGNNLGWRYIEWDCLNGFLSPVPKSDLDIDFEKLRIPFCHTGPIARAAFDAIASTGGDPDRVLFVAGFWGQVFAGAAERVIRGLLEGSSSVCVSVVCGTNERLAERLRARFGGSGKRVDVHGRVPSLEPFLRECASVVTKPGYSTLVEAHRAARAIFLIKGMPVAEENNARYALAHFGARWFTPRAFREWRAALEQPHG